MHMSTDGDINTIPSVRSFEDFYRAEFNSVRTIAYVLTGDRLLADELAQDAFVEALRAWDTIDHPSGWVRAVAANKSRSWWRRRYRERQALNRVDPPSSHMDRLPADTEAVWAAVRALPRRQAQVVALFYVDDRPIREIAAILGCAEATVRVHLNRARQSLAERLEDQP